MTEFMRIQSATVETMGRDYPSGSGAAAEIYPDHEVHEPGASLQFGSEGQCVSNVTMPQNVDVMT
eukprot:CAMPEP_0197046918 /NCGR_PEP_ID=MMETSP1384-20130603/22517_1 /TAXON_ID=29189 /ORGANISM="Ammonia sp." /LENGTH=64 /DNA_ID=CAMNT_0042478769 /DNA_START=1 /DNA_END=191 /DNA_ORIENTATION=+